MTAVDLHEIDYPADATPFLCPPCGQVIWVVRDGDDRWTECGGEGEGGCPTANAGRDPEANAVHEAALAWAQAPSYPVPHPSPRSDAVIVGRDETGFMATSPELSFRWYLTDCCLASAKGSMGAVVCRGCYQEIDDALGGEVRA